VRIGIDANRRIIVGKKKDTDKSGIGTRIIGIARSLSTVGSKISSYPLLEIALSVMVMISMIDLIDSIKIMIGDLMDRLGEELRFMIDWGVGSVCMTDLATVSGTFPGMRKNLKRWRMHEFPMNSYFVGMLILIEWSQEKIVVHR